MGEPIKTTNTIAIKHCTTGKWDTITISHTGNLHIYTYKEAVPIFKDWNNDIALNYCEFKIIK